MTLSQSGGCFVVAAPPAAQQQDNHTPDPIKGQALIATFDNFFLDLTLRYKDGSDFLYDYSA
jgi:hypothetical protein